MGVTLSSSQILGGLQSEDTELGNIAFAFKGLLLSRNNFALAAGLGVQTPTAQDNVILNPTDGSEALRVANNQARILPYIATLHSHGDWFWQNYVQVDAAANGNEVFSGGQKVGVLQQQNYIYVDSSLSRWIYRDFRSQRGLALTGELHYNRTVGTSDSFSTFPFVLGNPEFQAEVINLTFGSTYVIGKTTVTAAYGTPVTDDRGFDGEFRVLLNRFF
jgi:hypothetical protein